MKKNRFIKNLLSKANAVFNRNNIRYMIFLSFTLTAAVAVLLSGLTFYVRFSDQLSATILEENKTLLQQANQSLNTFLKNTNSVARLSSDILKNMDFDGDTLESPINQIYENYRETIQSISVFTTDGELLYASPEAIFLDVDVTGEDWFVSALSETENIHYSNPRVQRLFADASNTYRWVVPVSCSVEIIRGKVTQQSVLLVDIKYDALVQVMATSASPNEGYFYLTDESGSIIYHPKQQLIASQLEVENNIKNAAYRNEITVEEFNGVRRTVIVKSVGYTGWRLIGVIPQSSLSFDFVQNILFLLIIFFVYLGVLTIVNSYISTRLTDPIQKLEQSLVDVEKGATDLRIYTGGSYEIQHLGQAIQKLVDQMRKLTDDILREHELMRINELNALQAQINPHFLYNTLDIIVWTIENERPDEAVRLVTALARFFRISLSKGKNVISVSDELEHVLNYLTIQEMRYKDKFTYHVNADSEALKMSTIKLVIQPLVENAIYHSMDYMDGDGVIDICAFVQNEDLLITVADNGLGMTPETIAKLLTNDGPSSSRGSGIGLKNVNERIRLYFGKDYGVTIDSEPDEGTLITLRLPAIPYSEVEDTAANGKA